MENEIWKPVPGYEECYEVSNIGRVKKIKGANAGRIFIGAFDDYMYTTLTKDKKGKFFYIHRLVAMAFLPNPENKRTVNHINGIKTDNRVENLEWATNSENLQHAYRTGLHKGVRHTEEARKKMSEDGKGRIWVNNGIETHRIKPENLQKYLDNGYKVGVLKK